MTKERSVEDRIKQLIVMNLGVNDDEITANASFTDDLGADSLDAVELVMAVEDEFDIAIDDMDAEEIKTVGQLIDHVKKAVSS